MYTSGNTALIYRNIAVNPFVYPPNIKYVNIFTSPDCKPPNLPSGITHLIVGNNYLNLTSLTIPTTLTHLKLTNTLYYDLIIPDSVTHLQLQWTCPSVTLSSNIISLEIHSRIDKIIYPSTINIESLIMRSDTPGKTPAIFKTSIVYYLLH